MIKASTIVVGALACACVTGCGNKDDKSGGAPTAASATEPGAAPTAREPNGGKAAGEAATPAPDFSSWDVAGKAKLWQGSWLVKENGTIQAWTVDGDKVQSWDGEKDEAFSLMIEEPCRATFAETKEDGSVYKYPRTFASVDGKLRFRSGGAGYRRGTEAVFCDMSGAVYLLAADGTCTQWKAEFRGWAESKADCGFKQNDKGQEMFFHGGTNEGEFAIEGEAILSRASFETESVADHATARALRDERAAK